MIKKPLNFGFFPISQPIKIFASLGTRIGSTLVPKPALLLHARDGTNIGNKKFLRKRVGFFQETKGILMPDFKIPYV